MTVRLHHKREFAYTWEDFNRLRKISRKHTGILVPDEKFDMFYSRLSKRVRKLSLSSFKQYIDYLRANPGLEFAEFINALTTNMTSFFRENHHFDYLEKNVIPEYWSREHKVGQFRVWSAGCSSGEEPYSIAMVLAERFPPGWEIKILATDVDTQVLNKAAGGVYSTDQARGISRQRMQRWCQKGVGANSGKIKIKPEIRQLIVFRQLNLMSEWPISGTFDVIFCRNVLIYFDRETKEKLAVRFRRHIKPGGHLFIGHSESLQQSDAGFQPMGHTIYKKISQQVRI